MAARNDSCSRSVAGAEEWQVLHARLQQFPGHARADQRAMKQTNGLPHAWRDCNGQPSMTEAWPRLLWTGRFHTCFLRMSYMAEALCRASRRLRADCGFASTPITAVSRTSAATRTMRTMLMVVCVTFQGCCCCCCKAVGLAIMRLCALRTSARTAGTNKLAVGP